MKKGRDWRRTQINGTRILLTDEAVNAMTAPLVLTPDKKAQIRIDFAEPVAHILPDLVTVKVTQIMPNPRRISAKDESGKSFDVLVPKNDIWTVGDPLRIKVSDENPMYWMLASKPPRWRGDRLTFFGEGLLS